jgi:putative PIN family toxin of toxin-antitoxin system
VKIVLDTNVIFSALATQGLAHAVFELCLQQHEVVVSERILGELEGHLSKKLGIPDERVEEILAFLREFCQVGEPEKLKKPVCRDRSDDHVIGLAVASGAECIVSGDGDLLVLRRFKSIPILSQREFWEKLKARKGKD